MGTDARPPVADPALVSEFVIAGIEETRCRQAVNAAKKKLAEAKGRRKKVEGRIWKMLDDAKDGQLSLNFAQHVEPEREAV